MAVGQHRHIHSIVRRIPRGRVATYGQIATLAGLAGHARQIGYALAALDDDSTVPWHRVINAQGRVSVRSDTGEDNPQRTLLEKEGVVFSPAGVVSLERFRWQPRD